VLSMADLAQIWKAAELLGYPFGPYIRVLALTAQRRTEVAGMRWADLDLSTATWTIPAADTKGERRHHVPLSATAVEILSALPRLGAPSARRFRLRDGRPDAHGQLCEAEGQA
jgi:integrase